ncbi:hypothetical protein RMN57_29300 [Kitasatospora sp. CM 4170]|uniref:Uncharacterized protein n=1 Tax=Kitasatospora aburaviensis TaxID=67265 RepID=A0ABW1EPE9_9ACTN|nr:hypothetical protein [Kitasatospora sp. CM 4170]WNM48491.1 hypothetical protein RMN57_29300 [Kitasatospora sp. CM 4170]
MIVTPASSAAAVILGPHGERVRLRCLARRSLMTAACESFDHLRLSPGARHALPGEAESETVLHVLRGSLLVGRTADEPVHLAADGDLLLARRSTPVRLEAGPLGAELLCLTLAAPRRAGATGQVLARRRAERRTRP